MTLDRADAARPTTAAAHALHRAGDTVPLAQRLDLADTLPDATTEADLPDWLRRLLADAAPPTTRD